MSTLWSPKGLIAVLDTSVFVSARLSVVDPPSTNRLIFQAAGSLYDSFTSPAIYREVEAVLARPRFGIPKEETRTWLDVFIRASRQVDPAWIPGVFAPVLRDYKDSPILSTALAVPYHEEGAIAYEVAQKRFGCYIVSLDRHFTEGWTVHGWTFIRPGSFWQQLRSLS